MAKLESKFQKELIDEIKREYPGCIILNADPDSLRERATPKNSKSVSSGTINRIKAMSASYTIGEIADKLNMSPSTVSKYLKGGN